MLTVWPDLIYVIIICVLHTVQWEREREFVCMHVALNHVVDSHSFIVQLFYVLLNSKIYSRGSLAYFTNDTHETVTVMQ